MRVVFATSAQDVWGAEVSLSKIISGLIDKGVSCRVVCLSDRVAKYFSEVAGLSIDNVGHSGNRLRNVLVFWKALKRETSVVICSLDLLPLTGLLRGSGGTRVIVDLHDFPQQWNVRLMVRLFTRLANMTIFISEFTGTLARSSRRMLVRRPFEVREVADRPWCKAGGPLTVGVVGRLDPDKELGTLVSAMELLAPSEAVLVVVGGPSKGREDYANAFRQRTREQLGDRVRFTGVKSHDVFAGIDLLVVSNSREAAGRTVVEAMMEGVLTLVPSSGGASEWVTDGEVGFVYAARDPRSMAMKIRQIAAMDPKSIDGVRHAARQSVGDLTTEMCASRYLKALKSGLRGAQ